MSETTKLRSLIRDAMVVSLYGNDDLLATRAYHRDQLLQDVSNDIQTIVSESDISIELAIDEWINDSGCTSFRIKRRRKVACDALKRYPVYG